MHYLNAKKYFLYVLTFFIVSAVIFIIKYFDQITYRVLFFANNFGYYPDIYINFIIGLFLFLFLTLIVMLMNSKDYLYLWLIKSFVTIIFMFLYEYKYGLDSYLYYATAVFKPFGYFNCGGCSTESVILINSIFTYFVGESYYSLKLFNSFIGFLALIVFYKSFVFLMKENELNLDTKFFKYILFLFPTILFWSSTLGKEPLSLFFCSLFIYGSLQMIKSIRLLSIVLILCSFCGMYFVRPWFLLIFLITIFIFYSIRNFKIFLSIFLLTIPIIYFVVESILIERQITSINLVFEKLYLVATQMAIGNATTEVNDISSLLGYIYYFIPNLFTSLYRPLFNDVTNIFMLLAAVENIILLYLSFKFIFIRLYVIWLNPYLNFLLIFLFSWALLYTVISPGNLANAVRFKLQVLPIMFILIFIVRGHINNLKIKTNGIYNE